METVRDRLKQVMDAMGLKSLTPASTCKGITKNMMSKLWNQSTTGDVNSKILVPFCEKYTSVNCNWLIRGVGSMFIDEEEQVSNNIPTCTDTNYYKHILLQLLNADEEIAKAESKKKELYALIADKI